MKKKNNPGCGCCDTCIIVRDDFNRANSTDIGPLFVEKINDWSIFSNSLVCSSPNSLAICDTAHPEGEVTCFTWVTFRVSATNDVARIVIGYVDNDNYFFVQYKKESSGGQLRIGKFVAGIESYLAAGVATTYDATTQDMVLIGCYNGTRLACSLRPSSSPFVVSSTAVNAVVTGIKHGVAIEAQSGSISFKDFYFERHLEEGHANCQACTEPCSTCIAGTTPYAIQVEFDGVVDLASCSECSLFNDLTFLLKSRLPCAYGTEFDICDTYSLYQKLCYMNSVLDVPGIPPRPQRNLQILEEFFGTCSAVGDINGSFVDGTYTVPYDCSTPLVKAMSQGAASFLQCDFSSATCYYTPLI